MQKWQNPYRGQFCTVTGKPIVTDESWDIDLPSYKVFFGVLDRRIILLQAIGRGTQETSVLYEKHFSKVIREAVIPGQTYATCDDYRYYRHATNGARTTFINNIEKYHRPLKAIFFYRVSSFFRFVITVSKYLFPLHFKVQVCEDYTQAITQAYRTLELSLQRAETPLASSYYSAPEWRYQCGGQQSEFRLYRGSIIYNRIFEGMSFEQAEAMAKIDYLVNQYVRKQNAEMEVYSLVDLTGVNHLKQSVRRHYMELLQQNEKEFPCSYTVVIGTSFMTRMAVNVGRVLFSYPIYYARTLDHALEMIEQYRAGRSIMSQEMNAPNDDLEQFLQYLSSVQLQAEEMTFTSPIPSTTSMAPAYDALEMIRYDFNNLLKERGEKEKQLIELSERLADANSELEKRVVERTAELEEKNKMMALFFAKMSHDLRSPLQGIISFSNFGVTKAESSSPQTLKRYFSNIKTSSDNLLKLVNHLLDFNQMSSGKMIYHKELLYLADIMSRVKELMDSLAQEREISVTLEIVDNPLVLVDSERMEQLLINLLANAIKFSAAKQPIYMRLKSQQREGLAWAIIEVEDRGIGIPENERETVFETFQRCANNSSASGGSGLGLAICKEIVIAHQGRITVKSAQPQGSCFMVEIPSTVI